MDRNIILNLILSHSHLSTFTSQFYCEIVQICEHYIIIYILNSIFAYVRLEYCCAKLTLKLCLTLKCLRYYSNQFLLLHPNSLLIICFFIPHGRLSLWAVCQLQFLLCQGPRLSWGCWAVLVVLQLFPLKHARFCLSHWLLAHWQSFERSWGE